MTWRKIGEIILPPTPQATEDWDRELNEELKPYSYQTVRFYSYPTPQKEGSTINYEPPSPVVPSIGQPPVTKAGLSAVQLAEADRANVPALKLSVVI